MHSRRENKSLALKPKERKRVVTYVVNGQQFGANLLATSDETRFFSPIKESMANMSLRREFKPSTAAKAKALSRIKTGERVAEARADTHLTLVPKHPSPPVVRSQITPKPVAAKHAIVPVRDDKITNTAFAKPQLKSQELSKDKVLGMVRNERENSRRLVEKWLQSIRPYCENKCSTTSKNSNPKTTTNVQHTLLLSQQQKQHQQQQQLGRGYPVTMSRQHFAVGRPIFHSFRNCNEMAYFNYGYVNNYFLF